MLVQSSNMMFLNIDSKQGFFKLGKEAQKPGTRLLGTVTAIELNHDEGNIKKKVKPRDEVKLKIESGADTYLLSIPLGLFMGLKFLCQLPDCKSPHLTIVPREGEGENSDSPNIFVGYRDDEKSTTTIFCKYAYTFDKDMEIFNKQSKETITAKEILINFCELFEIPFTDKRPA